MLETSGIIQLLRKMGHDMRVPLNTLISTSDMLIEGTYDPLTPRQTKAITRLQRNNRRLLAILDDFITYVKADAGELDLNPKPFSPCQRLEAWCGQVNPTVHEKGLTLSLSVSENVPEALVGDETLLSRMALALLWNAVAFSDQGEIHVTCDWTPDQEWLLSVQDGGPGIPDDDLPHIYEPFWRGEARPQVPTAGAGLGLPMALALANTMGGKLFLKQTGAQGSVFCLQVPLQVA